MLALKNNIIQPTPFPGSHCCVSYSRMDRIHHVAVAMAGNNHVQKGCTLLTKEDRAIRCRTPGKRIGREERRAEMEL